MSDDPAAKLQTYKLQLQQVEAAIEQDPGNKEWAKLKADLLEVIQLTSELAQVKASTSNMREEELRTYSVGEKCQAIFEQDGQWYNAKIVALSEDGYFVTFLSYGNTAQVEFSEVRPYQRPDTSGWARGGECSAIYAADSRWYDAVLVEVKAASATIIFKGETDPTEVDIDFVRPKQAVERKQQETKEVEAKAAALPKSLEIRPDDSQEAIEKKKRKLNMFKRQERKEKEEAHSDNRRASWNSFAKKNKTINKAKNHHDPHWDPTRDHGELAARVQMEKYTTFMSRES